MIKVKRNRAVLAVLALVVAFSLSAVGPGVALGQSALDDPRAATYPPSDPNEPPKSSDEAGAAGSETGLNSNVGSLPFTGMDLAILALVAVALTGTGFALRRLSTPREPGS